MGGLAWDADGPTRCEVRAASAGADKDGRVRAAPRRLQHGAVARAGDHAGPRSGRSGGF